MDFLRKLGVMAFGSRLKRLLERLNKDISRFYQLLGVDFQPHWFSTLYLLGRRSPMTITGIAEQLSYTHPAVNKLVAQMSRAGLVSSSQGKKDRRQRLVRLTRKGRTAIDSLSPVWDEITGAMSGLLDESGHDFLASVDSLEDCLDTRSMYRRLTRSSKQRLLDEIEILDYRPTFKKHFKELNYRWLGQRFEVERHDEEILSDPLGKIIKPGGSVLFARLKGRIVGTIALIRHDGGTWEAAKLAVAEEARERYVGTRLMEAVIARARESGADKLHLETNPKDARLIGFLEGFGFRKSHSTPLPARYKRPRLTMELALTD